MHFLRNGGFGVAGSAVRAALRWMPRIMPATAARSLVLQAHKARDAGLYGTAAGLFEEALKFTPGRGRLHLQCGHMFKEARDFEAAQHHYDAALRLLPRDAEVAMQLGHFYKVSARPELAEAQYRFATELRPGWAEAADELARINSRLPEQLRSDDADGAFAGIVAELLPGALPETLPQKEMLRIHRFGGARIRHREGLTKSLCGVEAIRGYCISAMPITEIRLQVGDREVVREPIGKMSGVGTAASRKFVFNVWYDFSAVQEGIHPVTVRLMNGQAQVRAHSERLLIVPPSAATTPHGSDANVILPGGSAEPAAACVNALPSVIRPAQRCMLPANIRRILVQRADQMGDLACSVPAVRRLRTLFPDAKLVGLLTPANVDLGRSLDLFDDIIIVDFKEDSRQRRRTLAADQQSALHAALAPFDFDLAIDLGESASSRPLLLLSGARYLYGFGGREWPWLSASFCLQAPDPLNGLETMPPSRKILALVEALGHMRESTTEPMPRIQAKADAAVAYGLPSGQEFVLLHTGARLAFSRWPGFPELARLLLEQTTLSVLVLADGPDQSRDFVLSDRLKVIEGRIPFDHLEALLSAASVFVGNDSGPKHLAALRGTKVVSVHMARLNWSEWGQDIGEGHIISRRVPCAGCAISYEPDECGKDFACIRLIAASEVFNVVLQHIRAQ